MDTQKPEYQTPQVISYTDEDILEELGEAWGRAGVSITDLRPPQYGPTP